MDAETHWSDIASSPGFSWLAESKRYLLAAEVLLQSDEYQHNKLMITPTLHLVAHGIELFLKAILIRNGASDSDARGFSHNILELWNDDRNATARSDILTAADEEWEAAKHSSKWLDDFSTLDKAPLEEDLQRLSELHSRKSDFALRYVTGRTSDTAGPKPHLLSATFYRVVDRYIRDEVNQQPRAAEL